MRELETRIARGILGLSGPAPPDEVRRLARALLKRHHPDLGGEARDLQRVVWARDLLLTQAALGRSGPTRRAA